uniref:Uncharacterized protein n=1 Tax=viral metagenome TaxID=1070528 RepID=A0A6M3LHQ9_9ZZZZ
MKKKDKYPERIIVWEASDRISKWFMVEKDLENLSGNEGDIAIYQKVAVKKIKREISIVTEID